MKTYKADKTQPKAVVLLSGGLDSATVLAIASRQGYQCHALSFDYGQKNRAELAAAAKVAQKLKVAAHKTVVLNLDSIGGSALTDDKIPVPSYQNNQEMPLTYVPARNSIFLAIALGYAEVLAAADIFIGVNNVDNSGYPDCSQEFIAAFTQLANVATARAQNGCKFKIHAPLVALNKAQIIKLGSDYGLDYKITVSCYSADNKGAACGICDACVLRKNGFIAANIKDPTQYQSANAIANP